MGTKKEGLVLMVLMVDMIITKEAQSSEKELPLGRKLSYTL